ncbi:MAG: DUF3515 domain-containing protein [Nocardioides sp.]
MPRQRPVRANAGVVACLGVLGLLVAGCGGGAVEVADAAGPGDLAAREARGCASLLDALPDVLDGLQRRHVEPSDAYAAAWGDPAVVLRCGVGRPKGFNAVSSCQITNGVAWFIPDSQITGQPEAITMTTIGRSPGVEVRLPIESFPPAGAMVDLAGPLKQTTRKVERCG